MDSPHDDDECWDNVHRRRRDEAVRRAQLYGLSCKKKLPRVHTQPHDARTRKELQLLAEPEQLVVHGGLSIYEDELEQRKHQEHLGIRPALDQSHPLRDLATTVPRCVVHLDEDTKPASTVKHAKEWRVGYKNEPQSDFHGATLRGVFEPSDTSRERLVQTTDKYRLSSTALAYPAPFTSEAQVAQQLEPYDAEKAWKEMEAKRCVGMEVSPSKKHKHWTPASHATLGTNAPRRKSKASKRAMKIDQQFPVRRVASPLKKVELQSDPRLVRKQQALTNQVNAGYAEVQRQAAQWKDPAARYALPIENPKFDRAYRLGLDPVESTPDPVDPPDTNELSPLPQTAKSTTKSKPPLLFRPKSAVSLRMDTVVSPSLARSSSSTSLLSGNESVGKVAGAKRRPHSATVSYLSNSTVYFMNGPASGSPARRVGAAGPQEPPSTNSSEDSIAAALVGNAHMVLKEQKKYGANFLGVVLEERVRRHELQQERLFDLARRGALHAIPLPQIFARLRREALKNLTKRAEHARYEKLSLEEYMSVCGMAVVPETSPPRHDELRVTRPLGEQDDEDEEADDHFPSPNQAEDHSTEDPVIQALRDEVELRQLPFDEPASSVFRKRQAIRPDPVDGNNSSSVQAMRRALLVTREQFHIAMEAFALPTRDVNLLFSSLDLNVDDSVALWEIVCAIEQLQDGHQELRRSRVQVKARHLPKELSALRRSVSFPHRTHVALPLGTR